jgi:hypothetical protein
MPIIKKSIFEKEFIKTLTGNSSIYVVGLNNKQGK